jgi:hypothetical protein
VASCNFSFKFSSWFAKSRSFLLYINEIGTFRTRSFEKNDVLCNSVLILDFSTYMYTLMLHKENINFELSILMELC